MTEENNLSAEEKRKAHFNQTPKRFSMDSLRELRDSAEKEQADAPVVEQAEAPESPAVEEVKQTETAVKKQSAKKKDDETKSEATVVIALRINKSEYDHLFDLSIQESAETRKRCSPTQLIQKAYKDKYFKKGAK